MNKIQNHIIEIILKKMDTQLFDYELMKKDTDVFPFVPVIAILFLMLLL